jgi:hypothetical protein
MGKGRNGTGFKEREKFYFTGVQVTDNEDGSVL